MKQKKVLVYVPNNERKPTPTIYNMEERRVPETVLSVRIKKRNAIVELRTEGDDCEVLEQPIIPTKYVHTGCRIHWEGTVREFITLFRAQNKGIGLKGAFRNYVMAWYCDRNETVLIPDVC